MTIKVFADHIFPPQVADLMNTMYLTVFKGTDGEEKWESYLSERQKEYVALSLAQYYQCQHCIDHHSRALLHLDKGEKATLHHNVRSIVLFLRIDTRMVSETEKEQWIESWQRFAKHFGRDQHDLLLPYLVGLAIGIARNDEFLIAFCGGQVKGLLTEQGIDAQAGLGELEAVVVFMKAATSKNRVVDKVAGLFSTTTV